MNNTITKALFTPIRGSLVYVLMLSMIVFASCKLNEYPDNLTRAVTEEPQITLEKIQSETTSAVNLATTTSVYIDLATRSDITLAAPMTTLVPSVTPSINLHDGATQVPEATSGLALGGGEDYMLLTSNNHLWHPDMTTTVSEPFDKMSFSRAPWSPDGTHLAMRLLTHNGLAVLSIIDGSIVFLDETHPNSDAPLWSPDGRYLLFRTETINSQTPPRIAVYGLESGVIERETLPVELISLVGWSPDSSKVAMIRWNKENEMNGQVPVLEVLDLASGIAKVYQNPGKNFWVDGSWSPREDKLVLFGVDPDMGIPEPGFLVYSYRSIDLIDLDTGLVNLLLVGGTHDDEVNNSELPSLYINKMPWSPDGESIIYSDLGKVCYLDISSISVLCPDDLNSILLSTGAVGVDYPSWSPSGEWIGFVLSLPDTYGGPIAVIRPDGSDLRFTDQSSGEITLFGPVWSPNQ